MSVTINDIIRKICCLKKELTTLSESLEIITGNQALVEWTTGENFRLPAITRDADNVITTATVLWPDGETGVFTTVTKDATYRTIDAFTITHGSTTITQPLITRVDGAATLIPNLIIS